MGERDLQEMNKSYRRRRDLICHHLDDLSEIFSYVRPESAYFVFPKIIAEDLKFTKDNNHPESSSWGFALTLLDRTQVAVVPGVAFGPNGENHVRMSFGRSEKDIDRSLGRIKKFFGKK